MNRSGDHRRAAIVAAALWPSEAVAAARDDYGSTLSATEGQPDVAVAFMPNLILRRGAQ